MEDIPTIVEKDFVLIVDLEELQNYEPPVGEIGTDLLTEIKVSIDNCLNSKILNTFALFSIFKLRSNFLSL